MDHFGYDIQDFIPCELLGVKANDVHHIDNKGMGGSKEKDYIENLMAIQFDLHIWYGDKPKHMDFLKEAHRVFMQRQEPYIEVNPNHKSFDLLIGTQYEDRLMRNRRLHNEIEKFKV